MKVRKIIAVKKETAVKILGVTLLSEEEYLLNKDIIPQVCDTWWLRTPGPYRGTAKVVSFTDSLICCDVGGDYSFIRPVLKIYDSKSELYRGMKIEVANHLFTVLSDNLAICDKVTDRACFRAARRADDAKVFDASDIKKQLNDWAKKSLRI